MFVIDKLGDVLKSQALASHYVVAYSGGLDSHVLLHAMSQLKDFSFVAVHVNHQLSANAKQWASHCQSVCDQLGVPLHVERVDIRLKPGDSLEEQARKARYTVFKKYIDRNQTLLTAHNLDDQAETFLLQALRGAGLKGLSAMPLRKPFADGYHARPLLTFSRQALEAYANENQLAWIEDESNADTSFDRNYIRHAVMPALKQRFPAVAQSFSRSARLIAENEQVIQEVVAAQFEAIETDERQKVDYKILRSFSDVHQRLLLRFWLQKNNVRSFSEKQLKQIQQDVLQASSNAKPLFRVANISIRRDRNHLVLLIN